MDIYEHFYIFRFILRRFQVIKSEKINIEADLKLDNVFKTSSRVAGRSLQQNLDCPGLPIRNFHLVGRNDGKGAENTHPELREDGKADQTKE